MRRQGRPPRGDGDGRVVVMLLIAGLLEASGGNSSPTISPATQSALHARGLAGLFLSAARQIRC